ncbi:MAG: hypothetical protein AAF447_27160 [Myxococcota bacterium]
MRWDGHATEVRADVRRGTLERAHIQRVDRGRTWMLASGTGAPRLWQRAAHAALAGGARAHEEARELAPAPRLGATLDGARAGLLAAVNALVERRHPDCAFLVMTLAQGVLHVASAGNLRAYHRRSGQPKRLTPREQDASSGLLGATPTTASASLDPGDLVLAGTSTAFSSSAVGRVATVLKTDPSTPPSVLASLLVEPARQAGAGAAALALRVR